MIQCKIFKGNDVGVIERQINVWLGNVHNLERIVIHNTNQSSAFVPIDKSMRNVVTIFYERVKNKEKCYVINFTFRFNNFLDCIESLLCYEGIWEWRRISF